MKAMRSVLFISFICHVCSIDRPIDMFEEGESIRECRR
jgi:hypothetical protein